VLSVVFHRCRDLDLILALEPGMEMKGPNWPLLIPVVTGFLAVWYVLPTPRRRPLLGGLALVLAALGGLGFFLRYGFGREFPLTVESVLFASFALMAVLFAVLMLAQRNPARSAVYFAVVVLNVCGLFLLQAAPFLSAATIIIYAGAIIVTFLFVIMLSNQDGPSDENDRTREPSLAAAVGFVVLATLLLGLQRVYDRSDIDRVIARADSYANAATLDLGLRSVNLANIYFEEIRDARAGLGFTDPDSPHQPEEVRQRVRQLDAAVRDLQLAVEGDLSAEESRKLNAEIRDSLTYLKVLREGRINANADVKLSPHSQARAVDSAEPGGQLPSGNVAAIGRSLFTDHLIAVELAGTLLLVATIGTIAIAGRRRRGRLAGDEGGEA
jgi:NADH:ubiquinone oxidoreductase subunit 6 (subunit J)